MPTKISWVSHCQGMLLNGLRTLVIAGGWTVRGRKLTLTSKKPELAFIDYYKPCGPDIRRGCARRLSMDLEDLRARCELLIPVFFIAAFRHHLF